MILKRILTPLFLTSVAFFWLISPVLANVGNPDLYEKKYYVDSAVSNGGNGTTWDEAWNEFSDINWDNIRNNLVNGNVAVYFKGTFKKQLTILGEDCSYSNSTYTCADYNNDYGTTNRLYVGKHPDYSSPKITATYITYPILFGKVGYITIAGWIINGRLEQRGQTLIHGAALDEAPAVSRGHVHVVNNTITNAGQYNIMLRHSGDYNIIEGNTITGGNNAIYIGEERKYGGPHYSQYGVIRNNTITNIDPNRIYNYDAHFLGLQAISNYIIENNTGDSSGNVGVAIWCWSNWARIRSNVFRNNIIKDTWKAGITLRAEPSTATASFGNLVYQNTFVDNGSYDGATPQGSVNLNELMVESGKTGVRVFNNTIYDAYGVGLYGENVNDGEFFNNIVHHSNDGASATRFLLVDYTASSLYPDYNLYLFDGLSSSGSYWEYIGLKNWLAYSSVESNSPTPLRDSGSSVWVDAAKDDFALKSTSAALNTGSYLSSVASASGSGTELYVEDATSLHGNWNLKKADGSAVDGMIVTFYDKTNGGRWQDAEIIEVNHDTKKIKLKSSVTWIRNSSFKNDPAHTTQIALRFRESRPEIGAFEFGSFGTGKLGAPQGVSVEFILN